MICTRIRRFATYTGFSVVLVNLSGCADPQSYVFTKLIAPEIPAECLTLDPKWSDPPEADVKSDETARLARTNKDSFTRMRHDRSICRAALQAQAKG